MMSYEAVIIASFSSNGGMLVFPQKKRAFSTSPEDSRDLELRFMSSSTQMSSAQASWSHSFNQESITDTAFVERLTIQPSLEGCLLLL